MSYHSSLRRLQPRSPPGLNTTIVTYGSHWDHDRQDEDGPRRKPTLLAAGTGTRGTGVCYVVVAPHCRQRERVQVHVAQAPSLEQAVQVVLGGDGPGRPRVAVGGDGQVDHNRPRHDRVDCQVAELDSHRS